jgi:hypothetical protein
MVHPESPIQNVGWSPRGVGVMARRTVRRRKILIPISPWIWSHIRNGFQTWNWSNWHGEKSPCQCPLVRHKLGIEWITIFYCTVLLWTPAYTPGDGQTSWVYSNNPVLHLYISCYVTVNKPVPLVAPPSTLLNLSTVNLVVCQPAFC